MVVNTVEPMTEADVRGIFGAQRTGKTTIAVGFVADDVCENMTRLIFPDGQFCQAQGLKDDEIETLAAKGIQAYKTTHCRIFSRDKTQSKIIKIPPQSIIDSPVKVFANFHLFGFYYVHLDGLKLLQYINSDLITNGWVLMDESTMTDARDSMTKEGKITAKFGAQVGKRGLHLCTIAQYYEQIERRYRLFKTTTIECIEYDKETHYISCNVKVKDEPQKETEFFAPPYWKFFDTNEIIDVPQHHVDSALAQAYK